MANPFESASDVPIDSQPLAESGDDEDDMKSAVEEHDQEDGRDNSSSGSGEKDRPNTQSPSLLGGTSSIMATSLPGGSARRRRRPNGQPPAVSFNLLKDDVENNNNPAGTSRGGGDLRSPLLAHDSDADGMDALQNTDDIDDNNNCIVDPNRRFSLASDPSTPRCLAIIISTLMLATHGLFLYGQIAPMWRLRVRADVDVWANATTFSSRKTFDAIGLNETNHLTLDYNDDVSTFTYFFAIKQLWIAAGLPNKFMSRLAAVLLVIFSGVWPHLKLLLLHLTFLVPYSVRRYRSRTSSLYWLSTFGKYTLADVFVVCALIGIVSLDWQVDPAVVRDGLSTELPTLVLVAKSMYSSTEACTKMLGVDCAEPPSFIQRTKCWTCETAVNEAYNHPDWARGAGREILKGVATEGGGLVDLRVAGMKGIYPFCAAAILSLLVGVLVDILDHRSRRRVAHLSASANRSSRGHNNGGLDAEEYYGLEDHTYAALPPSASRNDPASRRCGLLLHRVLPPGGPDTWCQSLTAWFGYIVLIGASFLAAFFDLWRLHCPNDGTKSYWSHTRSRTECDGNQLGEAVLVAVPSASFRRRGRPRLHADGNLCVVRLGRTYGQVDPLCCKYHFALDQGLSRIATHSHQHRRRL